MLCELDASPIDLGSAPCITGQLKALDGRGDGASSYVKGRRQLVDGRGAPEEQHRHARQVTAVQSEDLRGDIIEGGRFLLKAHDLSAHQLDHLAA
jgi:hypothetical protein